ncbi:MAG: hypothetical protein KGI60_00325 [Patescibacteria group bacterium]|nr:hypothetical protein [Patescibacteria group bacterium]
MNFFSSFGVDIRLLIAQIVNFGILLWILNLLLYKPVISRIESDEKELNAARIQNAELDRKKKDFTAKMASDLTQSRAQSKDIITEAKAVAERITREAQKEADEDLSRQMAFAKKQALSLEESNTALAKQAAVRAVAETLAAHLAESLSPDTRRALNDAFFDELLMKIRTLPPETFSHAAAGGKNAAATLTSRQKKSVRGLVKEESEKLHEGSEGFSERMYFAHSEAQLTSAIPLTEKQVADAGKALKKVTGLKELSVVPAVSGNLVAGCVLEFRGVSLESNLLYEINHAAD